MPQTLREFIDAREAQVREQIRALNAELAELKAAKSAISCGSAVDVTRPSQGRLTHRDMIAAVLGNSPDGGTSDKVVEMVKARFGVDVPLSSMSSQLSRAKGDGVVVLDTTTKIWRSARHSVKENGPPEGGPEAEGEHPFQVDHQGASQGG
jgi:hypothetical protein